MGTRDRSARQVAEVLRPHVARVVIANTHRLAAISESKKKTDRQDARTLAQLLAAVSPRLRTMGFEHLADHRSRVSPPHQPANSTEVPLGA